jgi:hypothetical protein
MPLPQGLAMATSEDEESTNRPPSRIFEEHIREKIVIRSDVQTEIVRALQELLVQIDEESPTDIPRRGELRKLVVEAKTEAEKPNADILKLRSLLRDIAELIRFVGSLGPAYLVIKALLSYLGIHLP